MRFAVPLALALAACAPLATTDSSADAISMDDLHLTAMGPLDMQTEAEWSSFASDLAQAKALGLSSISIDVWWGQVERAGDQQFDWSWVDRAARTITGAGLKWRPVLAFHACGSNVGDTCNIPIPRWLFDHYPGVELRNVSAQGNASSEVLSVWATSIVLEQYQQFFAAFAERYAYLAPQTSGIAIGLGPASELRYPSYNAHDRDAGYPGPGVIQAYSPLARASWRAQFGSGLRQPEPIELGPMFAHSEHITTQRGRLFFDWYRESLLEHGRLVLGAAADTFQASPFRGTRLSARVPGVHWRTGDNRRAELSAGLISTNDAADWTSDERGHGYGPLVDMLAGLRARPDHPNVALEYTCLEKGNGEGGPAVASMAEALVFWVADIAHRRGVPIGGENALSGGLTNHDGWNRIANAVKWSHYDELTFLRLHDIVSSPIARERIRQLR